MIFNKGFAWVTLLVIVAVVVVGAGVYLGLRHDASIAGQEVTTTTASTSSQQVAGSGGISGGFAVTYPKAGSVLYTNKVATVRWSVPSSVIASFPKDFNLSVMLSVSPQDASSIAADSPIGDGWIASSGSAPWDIPSYISNGQLKPGLFKIYAHLQAQPKDPTRLCYRTVGKDCVPSDADQAVIKRAASYIFVTGKFTVVNPSTNPIISSLSQYSGPAGTVVIINGSGFTSPSSIKFNDQVLVDSVNPSNNGTSLSFAVPHPDSCATPTGHICGYFPPGPYTVSVLTGDGAPSGGNPTFTISQ